jgi:plasmid stabilization system protein ParE
MGGVVDVSNTMVAGLRVLRIREFSKYLLLYRMTKRGVEVLRVVHGARDYDRMFED